MSLANSTTRVRGAGGVLLCCAALLAGCSSESDVNPTIGDATTLTSPPSPTASGSRPSASSASATRLSITVAKGKAVGGLQELRAARGAHVVITVTSDDTTSEVHLHGYDLKAELAPSSAAVIEFDATISGVFDLELEETNVKVADLTVK